MSALLVLLAAPDDYTRHILDRMEEGFPIESEPVSENWA